MLLLLILFIHVNACAWFYVVSIEEKWVPNQDFVYYETELYGTSTSNKYWVSVYQAVLIFYVAELAPSTDTELLYATIVMLISSIITANIFGVITILLFNLNEPEARFE